MMVAAWVLLALLALLAWPVPATAATVRDSLLNVCMDAKHHKTAPGPEGQLHGQVGSSPATPAPTGVTRCGITGPDRDGAGGGVPSAPPWSPSPAATSPHEPPVLSLACLPPPAPSPPPAPLTPCPGKHRQVPAEPRLSRHSVLPGRITPAAPPTPACKPTRTSPTCTTSTGTTVGSCRRSANGTSSRTRVSTSAPPTWDPGSSRWVQTPASPHSVPSTFTHLLEGWEVPGVNWDELGYPRRRTAAGVRNGSCMCRCAWRTARSGGRTARTPSPARSTGTRAGTGPQVSGGARDTPPPPSHRRGIGCVPPPRWL